MSILNQQVVTTSTGYKLVAVPQEVAGAVTVLGDDGSTRSEFVTSDAPSAAQFAVALLQVATEAMSDADLTAEWERVGTRSIPDAVLLPVMSARGLLG